VPQRKRVKKPLKQSFVTKLRQIWVPAEFRLPEPEFTAEQLNILEELIQLMSPNFSRAEETIKDERLRTAHFLMELGTGIWRVRRKMEGLSRMPKEIKDALYSLESMWMSMSDGGVEIVDHIGVMPSKNEARIIEVRDTPGLARDQVIDNVKPTILIHGEVVQPGEVIVGRPAPPQYAAETMRPAVRPDENEEENRGEESSRVLETEENRGEEPSGALEAEENGNEESSRVLEAEENEGEELSRVLEAENLVLNSTGLDGSDESAATADTEPEAAETGERLGVENPAAGETDPAEDTAGQPAPDENDGEPKIETAGAEEAAIEIPLPQKRARRKGVLPASVKTKLAAIPEIGESPAKEKKEGMVPRRGRKRSAAAAIKNAQTETDGSAEVGGGVREEEA
jgi:hypothetical protein